MIYFIGKEFKLPSYTFNMPQCFIENSTIQHLLEYFKDKTEVGLDLETTGFDPYIDRILSYQLGNGVHQFVVDASMYPITVIEDILLNKELLIHNAKFDLKFLYHIGIYPTKVWDTYLGECVLYKGDRTTRKSLEATVQRYFKYSLNKTIRGKIFREGFSRRVIEYCSEDVRFLLDIKQAQWNRLNRQDLLDSMALENLFVKVLTYIEYSGIYLDVNLWRKKIIQDTENYEKSLKELDTWIIDNNITKYIDSQLDLFNPKDRTLINWSSPKQVTELFKSLGINTEVKDDKTGELKDSIESTILEKQVNKSSLVPIYLIYKKYEKTLSTYGESIIPKIHPITGRIHTQFTQIMNTGRLSSGGKIGDKETINLQNIPRMPDDKIEGKIYERECFTAENGNILVNSDYSGQEQIVFANWTLDKDLLAFYEKGLGDMHSFIASKIFPELKDISLSDIKKYHKEKRQIAKAAGFAINYGGDGNTIADNLNLPKEEGDAIYKAYFQAFPGISDYFKKATNQALRDGYILFNNISKSRCFINFFDQYRKLEEKVQHTGFWERYREEKANESILYRNELKPLVSKYFKLKGNISRMALNFPIQGSSAEITKLACIYIFDYLIKYNLLGIVKFSNVIHDEILLECPENLGTTMKTIVESCMVRAGNIYCKVIPLKAECKLTKYWNH